jgi:hypothetical protein
VLIGHQGWKSTTEHADRNRRVRNRTHGGVGGRRGDPPPTRLDEKETIMPPLSLQRHHEINYHFEEGVAWLEASVKGINTTPLSYAAFEFRLAIERIVLQYWSALAPGGFEEKSFQSIRSYKSIEKQIFQIAGHQKEINSKFEFARLLIDALKIPWKIQTPDIGRFSSYWHECSELCHIAWTLVAKQQDVADIAFQGLSEIADFLRQHVDGVITWANISNPEFGALQDDFVAGRISVDDVLNHLKKVGVYAVAENIGEPRVFIGEAIPPATDENTV